MANKINTSFPILPVQPNKAPQKSNNLDHKAFQSFFQEQIVRQEKVKFSAHAQKRLAERNIHLDEKDLQQIEAAVSKAQAKGAKESLLLYGDIALVTSIRNKTVVTAVDGESMEEHVFTNIDSALIVKKKH